VSSSNEDRDTTIRAMRVADNELTGNAYANNAKPFLEIFGLVETSFEHDFIIIITGIEVRTQLTKKT